MAENCFLPVRKAVSLGMQKCSVWCRLRGEQKKKRTSSKFAKPTVALI